jgi:HTH-type transcriptional regulator / antitoxin HigA
MEYKRDDYRTPGQLINGLLEKKGWNQRVLAIVLGISDATISLLLSDKRPITAELALTLHELFGEPAERFLELQQSYDLAKAKLSAMPDADRNLRAHLFGGLPVSEMIKRGWLNGISDIRNVPAIEASLAKFFGVEYPDQIEILPHAAKKTIVTGSVTPSQLAWLYRVKQVANMMLTAPYSPVKAKSAITKLSALLASPEETRNIHKILTESGIRFVIVESLPSAQIDGVCFWLNDNKPVIGMSLRHDRIDNFWFVLRHELEHVIQLDGKGKAHPVVMLDTDIEEKITNGTDISKEELIANEAASDFCVPQKSMDSFITRKSPLFSERDMIGFSRTMHIHPGLVVGQIHHRTGRYELFRKYLVKIRHIVTRGAMVDGWGDIAPVDI